MSNWGYFTLLLGDPCHSIGDPRHQPGSTDNESNETELTTTLTATTTATTAGTTSIEVIGGVRPVAGWQQREVGGDSWGRAGQF